MAQANFKVVERPGKGEALVRPPFDTATKGIAAGLKIQNKTSAKIWVFLPDGVFNELGGVAPDPVAMYEIASGVSQNFKTHALAKEGAYSFPVFCESTFSFAKGNSDPEFIIEN